MTVFAQLQEFDHVLCSERVEEPSLVTSSPDRPRSEVPWADVLGIFPNDNAIIRLVVALRLDTNDEWTVAPRYMSLETLARVTDNPAVGLPAVAT
jgi:hypothetical protein